MHEANPSHPVSEGLGTYLYCQIEPVGTARAGPVHTEGPALGKSWASCTSRSRFFVTTSCSVFSTHCPWTERTGKMLNWPDC